MQTRCRLLIALIVASTSSARARSVEWRPLLPREPVVAPTPTDGGIVAALGIDSSATLARANVVVREVGGTAVGTLTLTLTSDDVVASSTILRLPRDARVVAMTLDHGRELMVGHALAIQEANRRFTETVDPPPEITVPRIPMRRDPALLQLDASDGDWQWLRLTVFPVMRTAPATVTVTFAMQRFDRLQVYVDGQLRDELGAARRAAATPDDVELAARPAAVIADRVLYAAPAAPAPSVPALADGLAAVLPALARCAALDDHLATQEVALRVHVNELGRASLDAAGGASLTLDYCLRLAVETLQFGYDAPVVLSYALRVAPSPTNGN